MNDFSNINNILSIFFGMVYSFGAFSILIWAIAVFFSTEIRLEEFFKKFAKFGVGILLILNILSYIFILVNNRLIAMIDIYSEALNEMGVNQFGYLGWVVLYTIVFFILLVISLFIIYMYICTGFKISKKTKLPAFPLIFKSNDPNPVIQQIDIKHIFTILGSVLGMTVFTFILFKLTGVEISENVKQVTEKMISRGISMEELDTYSYLILIIAAIKEEIIFRFVGQRLLYSIFKNKVTGLWFSVILISMIWSFGHFGLVEPVLVKVIQIFIFGILLGLVSHYRGIGSAILIHLFFNLLIGFMNPYLF